MNKLVIGVATIEADDFRRSRLSSPADFVGVQILQLFQNNSYLDLGKGEMVGALASCCGGCRAVDRGRGSHVESMAAVEKFSIIVDLSW